MHSQRIAVAIVAIPLLAATIVWLPVWAFLIVLGAATILACDEFLGMAREAGIDNGRWLPLLLTAALLAASWSHGAAGLATATISTLLILSGARLSHQRAPQGALAAIAAESFAVLFVGSTAACLGWLRLLPADGDGIRLIILFLVSIWVGDSGAYYVGRQFGRHKMSPRISPNKTIEGLLGGIAATIAVVFIGVHLLELPFSPIHTAAIATILAIAAPLGDLVESQFKRDSGVKDSSTLLPGHGGFLDRTDSLFYAAPPVLGYLLLAGLIG